jgi:hypothetical protein
MKLFTPSKIILGTLLLLGFTSSIIAEPTLPISKQAAENSVEKIVKEEKIEIVPEIKIEAQTSTTPNNSKLKQGDACDDENLEEVKGELFTEIPMAKTMPCDSVDCKDLEAAKMHDDNYVPLKNAKTISCQNN